MVCRASWYHAVDRHRRTGLRVWTGPLRRTLSSPARISLDVDTIPHERIPLDSLAFQKFFGLPGIPWLPWGSRANDSDGQDSGCVLGVVITITTMMKPSDEVPSHATNKDTPLALLNDIGIGFVDDFVALPLLLVEDTWSCA